MTANSSMRDHSRTRAGEHERRDADHHHHAVAPDAGLAHSIGLTSLTSEGCALSHSVRSGNRFAVAGEHSYRPAARRNGQP